MDEQLQQIDIPRAWEQIRLDTLRGVLMVIGAPDLGKSTLARYLYHRLCAGSRRVAYLDGDPGQSALGPPATMTLAINTPGNCSFLPEDQTWRSFVGAVSLRGHMLPLLVGASRLVGAAHQAGAEIIIYDTTGLVDLAQGGVALKLAKIDLLHPATVFALQRGQELESLLVPLRRSRRVRVVDVPPSPVRRSRDTAARQTHRAAQFAAYFATAHPLTVEWRRLAVLPSPRFVLNRLVALEDVAGFTLGLGIIIQNDPKAGQVTLHTPLASVAGVDMLHLGDVVLNPHTFRDQPFVPPQSQTG